MKKTLTIVLALVLVFACCITLFACDNKDNKDPGSKTPSDTLTIAYSPFSNKFSPFFADTAYDMDVQGMTQIGLLASDRNANVVYDGINGETIPYNGTDYTYYGLGSVTITQNQDSTVDYDITIRSGDKTVYFSDGQPVTIKDVLFSMYVLADTDYDGSTTFYSLPIEGMNEYRTGLNTTIYTKYATKSNAIVAQLTADKAFGYTAKESDAYTQDDYDSFVDLFDNSLAWELLAKDICAYCAAKGYDGFGSDVANGMGNWGFGKFGRIAELELGRIGKVDNKNVQLYVMDGEAYVKATDGAEGRVYTAITEGETTTYQEYTGTRYGTVDADKFFGSCTGEEYANPTIADYVTELKAGYDDDFFACIDTEAANLGLEDIIALVAEKWISQSGADEMAGQTIDSISGITQTGEASIRIHCTEFSATTIYQLTLAVTPLHYYGSTELYNGTTSFGFTKGDLTAIRSKTTTPMGAGPYKFVSFEQGIVTFERNENYWEGCPKIKYIKFKEYTTDTDKTPALISGDIDIATPSISDSVLSTIKSANSNGQLVGNTITTDLVDYNGYGYIGICSDRVYVGSVAQKGSEESKALRKAFATIFAAYREYTVNSYYGDRAGVIEYPISNCSWAAPQPADEGYAIAYSKDAQGNPIYTADMNDETKWVNALAASKSFFLAAGYTFDDQTGKFTAAPEGASLSYTAWIPADGTGDHPSFALLTKAKEALATIGIELVINDLKTSTLFWTGLDGGTVDMWCAAWGGSSDPDMYQVYHSDNKTNSNHYRIADADLDTLIIDARKSADKLARKAYYKTALEKVLDWGVEIPVYQRKDCTIFSTERVNLDTLTKDTTPFWTFLSEIYTLEMK